MMKLKWLCLLLVSLMLLAGCGDAPETAEPPETQPPATQPEVPFAEAVQQTLSQEADSSTYALQLTQEQADRFTRGKFTLFRHYGGDRFIPIYFSEDVTLEGNALKANFNGKVLYLVNDAGMCYVLPATEMESKDGKTYYTADISTGNYIPTAEGKEEYTVTAYIIHAVFSDESGQLINMQILPQDQPVGEEIFLEGEPVLPEEPDCYVCSFGLVYLAQRDAAGDTLTLNQWISTGGILLEDWGGSAGVELAYGRVSDVTAPYAIRDVYMVISAYGQEGERYDSQPILVPKMEVPGVEAPEPETVSLQWEEGNTLLLMEEQGVSVYLRKNSDSGDIVYDIQFKNDSQVPVVLTVDKYLFNDRYGNRDSNYITADPGDWGGTISNISFPLAAAAGELGEISSIALQLQLKNEDTQKLLAEKNIRVNVTGPASLQAIDRDVDLNIQEPYMEYLLSEEQLLTEQQGVRVWMIKAGKDPRYDGFAYFYRMENTTDEWRHFVSYGAALNDVFFEDTTICDLSPGEILYEKAYIDELYGMEALGAMKLNLGVGKGKQSSGEWPETGWYAVTPDQKAQAPTLLQAGQTLLLEEQGLHITLLEEKDGEWTLLAVNTTDRDMVLEPENAIIGDSQETVRVTLRNNMVGAHQSAVMTLTADGEQPFSFGLMAMNFAENAILFRTEGRIALTPS